MMKWFLTFPRGSRLHLPLSTSGLNKIERLHEKPFKVVFPSFYFQIKRKSSLEPIFWDVYIICFHTSSQSVDQYLFDRGVGFRCSNGQNHVFLLSTGLNCLNCQNHMFLLSTGLNCQNHMFVLSTGSPLTCVHGCYSNKLTLTKPPICLWHILGITLSQK